MYNYVQQTVGQCITDWRWLQCKGECPHFNQVRH